MVCVVCFSAMPHTRASKRFCGDACRQKFYRQRQTLRVQGLSDTPVCHLGRFQDYQEVYAGKIDVLITDPPYAREICPLRRAGQFARTVLKPGGALFTLSGDELELEARQVFNASGLEWIGVVAYVITSVKSQGRQKTSTGLHKWQRRHKPILRYQQPGLPKHDRGFTPQTRCTRTRRGPRTQTTRGSRTPRRSRNW